jgi:hypothetical protein
MFITYLLLLGTGVSSGPKFPCLPASLTSSDIVSAEWIGGKLRRVTVQDTLTHMKARCEHEKLVDRNKREIRFYRVQCFGAPTTYALETTHRQAEELKALRATYTVITMTCTPDGLPRP